MNPVRRENVYFEKVGIEPEDELHLALWEPGGEFIKNLLDATALINEFQEVDDEIHTTLFH